MLDYKDIAKRQSTNRKPGKVMPHKTVKVKNQTSTHMTKTKGPARESGRVEQKRKQQIPTTKSGFQATEPMTSRRLKQSSDKPKKIKRAVDSKSPRTGRATRVTKPVTGNIGEIKTQNKSNKIEEKRQQRKTLLRNRPTGDTTGKRTLKVEQARKSRPDKKDKSLDTSGKRTTKIEQARKAKISLQRAGGGKVGSKYFTGGMVNPSYGTDFDDR